MITINELAQMLEDRLNGYWNQLFGEYANISEYGLDQFYPNTTFRFKIQLDGGELKKAERVEGENKVIRYINGILRVIGDDKEGYTKENYISTTSTAIELVIPDCMRTAELVFDGADGRVSVIKTLKDAVRELLDTELAKDVSDIEEKDGIFYSITQRFSVPIAGNKESRAMIGESITYTIYADYVVVANGVDARKLKYEIKLDSAPDDAYEEIFPENRAISRKSIKESAILCDSSEQKNVEEGSGLVISFDEAYRINTFSEALAEYLLGYDSPVFNVRVTIPIKSGEKSRVFDMIFAECGLAGETGCAVASSVRLVDKLNVI